MQKQTQPAEPVRKANGSIWDNRFFLGIVSVLAAVLVWMVVSTFLDPQGSFVIKDVSVNYGYQSTIIPPKGWILWTSRPWITCRCRRTATVL